MQVTRIAKICRDYKIDAVSLVNTVPVIKIDRRTGKAYFRNRFAGMSGPCIKNIALKKVSEATGAGIPVIGIGGIMNSEDVLEFLSAGAKMVQVGSANLVNPRACRDIIRDLNNKQVLWTR